ncbi:unnamed protein product [Absidia cylindrospora]
MSLQKRQDSSYACSQKDNQYPYCSPLTTDTWVNGTTHQFIWNFNFPFYVSSDTLTLNLYYIKNYQYTTIKTWTDLTTSDGELTATVDDSWFPTPNYDGNKTWPLYIYYLPSAMNASAELQNTNSLYPRPYNFSVIQLPSPEPPNSNLPPNSNTPTSYSSNQHHGLPGWGIALIVIASVAVAAVLGILAWAYLVYLPRKRRQNANNGGTNEKGPSPYYGHPHGSSSIIPIGGIGGGGSPNEKTESIYSHSPMFAGAAAVGVHSSISVGGCTSQTSLPPSIHRMTSQDSVTMSDSLRQMVYRPDWTTIDEDMDEEKRRRLGEELLQRQLAEDGATTMVKQTQPTTRLASMTSQIPKARTAIVVADSSDSLSHSSSSTTFSPTNHPPP